MKLEDITEAKKPGTYAGVRFSPSTVKALRAFGKDNGIPNRLPHENFHTTLLYSRKHLPNYTPVGDYDNPLVGIPKVWEKWPSKPDDDGKVSMCLVLQFTCPELVKRHKELMDEHDAHYDFDEYKPHVTLSYDVGDFNVKDLPTFGDDIEIVSEYQEELKDTWANEKTKGAK